MDIKSRKRKYAATYREKNREKYNEYCNKWYHDNIELQRVYKNEWRWKKIKKMKEEGIINVWEVINKKGEPRYESK